MGIVRTFEALAFPNFRLYFIGQSFSFTGTWIQRIAQAWLVLELTGTAVAVGAVTALQFLPLLLVSPFGGLLADRFDKRKTLYLTQIVSASSALVLGGLVLTDVVALWMVYGLAFALGIAASIDNPVRQSFVMEMVPRSSVANAVTLHSTLVNATRILGPALAAVLIKTIGIGWCFVANSLSYVALLVCVALMDKDKLYAASKPVAGRGQVRSGVRYALKTFPLGHTLALLAVAGLFAYQYQVVLPVLATEAFNGEAGTFALMSAIVGVGSVVGGLVAATVPRASLGSVSRLAVAFGVLQMVTSMQPTLLMALIGLAFVGALGISFVSFGNAVLQLHSEPAMRGRVMGLYEMAFFGTTALGAPIMGVLSDRIGPRWTFAMGGLSVAAVGVLLSRRTPARQQIG